MYANRAVSSTSWNDGLPYAVTLYFAFVKKTAKLAIKLAQPKEQSGLGQPRIEVAQPIV